MGLVEFITKLFGNKSQKDMREIMPYVEKIKLVYEEIDALSNDDLRARSAALMARIQERVADKKARIVELKDHHRSRLDETLRAVKENPGEGAYLLAGKLTWNIRRRSTDWEDFPLPQKWFAVGECIAHLNYLRFRDQIRLEMDNGHCRYFAV